MKLQSLLLASALILSVSAHALSAAEYDKYTDILMPTYLEEFAQAVNYDQLSSDVAYKLSTTEVDDRCVALMDGKMISGDVGKVLSQIFLDNKEKLGNLVVGGSVKSKYCPRYGNMTEKEKSIVWVFILTAMSHFESSCNRTASATGPNGTAYGYYQLHRNHEQDYDGDKGMCQKGDAGKPVAASKCTLGMLDKQFENRKGELFSSLSYWDVLRPSGASKKWSVIKRALMQSSLCNPRSI
ncbi:hypothetical protein CIK05_09930 [Bdellovibrio sp. qaytius]|nr:hypothetical protein CIK05_09930 [Bdellovibrio sp. qaytius]